MTDDAIRKVKTGVHIITTKCGDKLNGLAVAWVSRVSMQPPMVMISIGKTRYSHDLIKKSKIFAVNVLGEEHIEIGRHFGLQSGKKVDKFKDVEYEQKATGAPIIRDCIAYLDCKVINEYDAGDHTIFVGEVVDSEVLSDEEPLIYNRDDFY